MAAWVCRLLIGVQWLLELHASGIVPGLFCLTFKGIFFSFSYPFERCRTNGSSAQASLQFEAAIGMLHWGGQGEPPFFEFELYSVSF